MAVKIRTPKRRTRREFAEQEIVIPDGPHKGRKFHADTQPFAGLLLDAMDSGNWNRFAVTGTTQSGKSTIGYVIPSTYHNFECEENVILGLPDLNMATDKWTKDIQPVIKSSRYADLLPTKGRGSRSNEIKDSITFGNHTTLKVMSGGGGDNKRSGYTTRVVCVTEADKMDESGGSSRETNKIGQIEARTDAHGDNNLVYMECTVSVKDGRIWQEYTNGTRSRIACPCPHCKSWVTPEREHLVGWQGTETEMDARDNARWVCPDCGAVISEAERVAMNRAAVLVHKGQEITPEGVVVGPLPRTRTLGFRWNAFNNLFWTASIVAAREWKASRNPNEEDGKKEMCQFVWVIPYEPPELDLTQLEAPAIARRCSKEDKGRIPTDAVHVAIGVDVGQRLCHWVGGASREDGGDHVFEYGRFEVASDEIPVDRALLMALRDFRDQVVEKGWAVVGGDESRVVPDQVWIDSGWAGENGEKLDEVIYAFCKESNDRYGADRYVPSKGWSATEYRHPVEKSERVREIGDQYHIARVPEKRARLAHINTEHYKARSHDRLRIPMGNAGGVSLFHPGNRPDGTPDFAQHTAFSKHIVAEKRVEKNGDTKWVVVSRNNHFLDSLAIAVAALRRAAAKAVADAANGVASARQAVRRTVTGQDAAGESPVAPPAPTGWFAKQRGRS